MNKRKLILIICILVLLPATTFSASVEFTLREANCPIVINGQTLDTGTPVVSYNGVTMVSLDAVSSAMDMLLEYSDSHINIYSAFPDEIAESCVMVYAYDRKKMKISQGSGVLIGYEEILTCNHVIDKGKSFEVEYQDGENISCSLELSKSTPDMAILKPDKTDVKPVKIGDSDDLIEGDKVFIVSCPKGEKNVITYGKVEATNIEMKGNEGSRGFVVSANTDFGSSGGACFNSKGELIGIVKSNGNMLYNSFILSINEIRKNLVD